MRSYFLLILTVLFWSGNFVAARAAHADVPPLALAFWRWAVATAVILPFAWGYVKTDWPAIKQHWRWLLVLAVLSVGCFNTFVYLGLQTTQALNALIFQSLIPVSIVIFAFVLYQDRLRLTQLLGVAVSFCGALFIISQGSMARLLAVQINQGDVWLLAAVSTWGLYSVLLRNRPQIHALSFLLVTFSIGLIALLPLYVAETMVFKPMPFSLNSLLLVGYVGIFPSILSYLFYNRGVAEVGAARAGIFIHLMPFFGGVLAVIFLRESLHYFHGVGLALILLGILAVTKKRPS